MRVLVVVPAFNEARSLPAVAAGLRACGTPVDVCVVDDGSTDGTAEVARGLGLQVLRLPLNLGIGGAVQTGYRWARARGYDAVVQLDGDDQHDATSLPALLGPLECGQADLVIGSRFLQPGGFRSTPTRRLAIRYLSWFLRFRCGARVTDPTSGFRAAGPRALALFADDYPSDYPEPEAVALARRRGLTVMEVPAGMRARSQGRSSISALGSIYYLVKVSVALLLLPHRRLATGARPSGRQGEAT